MEMFLLIAAFAAWFINEHVLDPIAIARGKEPPSVVRARARLEAAEARAAARALDPEPGPLKRFARDQWGEAWDRASEKVAANRAKKREEKDRERAEEEAREINERILPDPEDAPEAPEGATVPPEFLDQTGTCWFCKGKFTYDDLGSLEGSDGIMHPACPLCRLRARNGDLPEPEPEPAAEGEEEVPDLGPEARCGRCRELFPARVLAPATFPDGSVQDVCAPCEDAIKPARRSADTGEGTWGRPTQACGKCGAVFEAWTLNPLRAADGSVQDVCLTCLRAAHTPDPAPAPGPAAETVPEGHPVHPAEYKDCAFCFRKTTVAELKPVLSKGGGLFLGCPDCRELHAVVNPDAPRLPTQRELDQENTPDTADPAAPETGDPAGDGGEDDVREEDDVTAPKTGAPASEDTEDGREKSAVAAPETGASAGEGSNVVLEGSVVRTIPEDPGGFPVITIKGVPAMTLSLNGETVDLESALRFTGDLAIDLTVKIENIELSVQTCAAGKVTGPALTNLQDAMELLASAQAAVNRSKAEFQRQLTVKDAYDSVQGAGDKAFVTGTTN